MSVIIKGMEMPKTCKECPFSDHEAWCLIPGDWRERYYMPKDERSKYCPLIELPPHGRLIDADVLLDESEWYGERATYDNPMSDGEEAVSVESILNAPIVIEVEKNE